MKHLRNCMAMNTSENYEVAKIKHDVRMTSVAFTRCWRKMRPTEKRFENTGLRSHTLVDEGTPSQQRTTHTV